MLPRGWTPVFALWLRVHWNVWFLARRALHLSLCWITCCLLSCKKQTHWRIMCRMYTSNTFSDSLLYSEWNHLPHPSDTTPSTTLDAHSFRPKVCSTVGMDPLATISVRSGKRLLSLIMALHSENRAFSFFGISSLEECFSRKGGAAKLTIDTAFRQTVHS